MDPEDIKEKILQQDAKIARLDDKIMQLETKLEDKIVRLETKLEDKIVRLETKLDGHFTMLQDEVKRQNAKVDKMIEVFGNQLGPLEGAENSYETEEATATIASPTPLYSLWFRKEILGFGAFATVYKGVHRESGAFCAIKVLNDPGNREHYKQFKMEIDMLSKLNHKNIVQYYGSEEVNREICIYLEFVRPGPISNYRRESGVLTELIVRNFTRHILTGLKFLHEQGIMHRDIKGDNILVDATGVECVAKLADFGLAKIVDGLKNSNQGTPQYMAPEIIHGKAYSFAVDIWSLGCTVVEMFTGENPWGNFDMVRVLHDVSHRKHPEIPSNISSEGRDFLLRCFEFNPDDRATVDDLLKHSFVDVV